MASIHKERGVSDLIAMHGRPRRSGCGIPCLDT
jgi:hypothetical protein